MSDERSPGRGGSPAGFIGRSIVSDIHRTALEESNDYVDLSDKSTINGNGRDASDSIDAEHTLAIVRDLKKSGLEPKDVNVRPISGPERAVCGVPIRGQGYVIPYFDITGNPLAFYRVKILNADYATNGIKYKQPRKTPNHLYYPKNFRQTLLNHIKTTTPSQRILIITEGEKKAACATKFGFPCVAVSGVDSWKSRTILLPEDTEFYSTTSDGSDSDNRGRKGGIKARLPSTDTSVPELITLAQGFGDMIDTITQYQLHPVIIYDSDQVGTLKAEVQRAATMLGYEFVFLGIHTNRIKQVILPALLSVQPEQQDSDSDSDSPKTGLDDYITEYGPHKLRELIDKALQDPGAFPKHPNPKGFISTQLQNRMSRKAMQQVASMILTELDAGGLRLKDKLNGQPYYYDRHTAHLIPVLLSGTNKNVPFHEQAFGTLLYQKYGISANDQKVLTWLASQFTGEEPIEEVTSRKVTALITEKEDVLNPHGIAYQISDSQYLAVSPDEDLSKALRVCTNGEMGILFEQNQVEPLDSELILEEFEHQVSEANELGYLKPWWSDVLSQSSIGLQASYQEEAEEGEEDSSDEPNEEGFISLHPKVKYKLSDKGALMRTYATLLYYISPFLLRWRGLQLPVEMTVGPPGSGKSSLYSLRLSILTGRPLLRNIPSDIKDWQAGLAHTGGLHVTDNVHFLNKELKQRISDELCRITTEPNPQVEQRRLYTNVDTLRFPINCVFGFTSIQMPFNAEDLIQRSITFHTEFVDRAPEGNWVDERIQERGSREHWVAHHMAFLHLFLREDWDPEFKTSHRLAHLEQSLTIAARIIGLNTFEMKPTYTTTTTTSQVQQPQGQQGQQPQGQQQQSLGQVLRMNQSEQIEGTDWVVQGIRAFLDEFHPTEKREEQSRRFFAQQVSEWCQGQEDYMDNEILNNPRRLGKYMMERSSTIAQTLNIHYIGSYANRASYCYMPK